MSASLEVVATNAWLTGLLWFIAEAEPGGSARARAPAPRGVMHLSQADTHLAELRRLRDEICATSQNPTM